MIQSTNAGSRKELQKANTIKLGYWTLGWLLTTALATFGPIFLWENSETITILAILFNVGIGVGMILANKNFLVSLDELQQRIQLESMGITLGLTLIFGIAFSMLGQADLMILNADISLLIMFMGLTYMVVMFINTKRYQ